MITTSTKISLLSVFTGTLMAALTSTSVQAATDLTLCTEDKDQAPYVIGASGLAANPGIAVEIIQKAAGQMGVTTKIIRAPWKRCLSVLEKGEVDGVFLGSFKKERMKFGAFPMAGADVDPERRVSKSSYSLYRLKGTSANWDGKAFSGIDGKVGAPLGYSIVKDLEKKGLKMEESKGTETDFKKLTSKRIVAAAALTNVGDALIEGGAFPNVEKVETPLVTKPYYLLLSNQLVAANKEMTEKFWNEIAKVREAEGKALFKKYN